MAELIDLKGRKFGRLVVLRQVPSMSASRNALWECVCECGTITTVLSRGLRKGRTKSCGCYAAEAAAKRMRAMAFVHGLSRTKTYRAWSAMKLRCLRTDHPAYPSYGGRGITVCERWMEYENFLHDMGEAPEGMSLERKDNDKGYGPDNCCWATPIEQQNNQRRTVRVTINGRTQSIANWARELGISYSALKHRYMRHGCFDTNHKPRTWPNVGDRV